MFSVEVLDHDRRRAMTTASVVGVLIALAIARFGMPPVDLHSPLHRMGVMDPFCGMTRAARALAQLRLRDAMRYNPASPLLVTLVAGLWVRSLYGWATGHWIDVRLRWTVRTVLVLVVVVGALEVRQQMNAAFLR